MRIKWSAHAKKKLQSIFSYYSKRASIQIANKIVDGILIHPHCLLRQTKLGPKEPLLSNKKDTFRYLVHKNYKIVYTIHSAEKIIYIVDIFDTRQNPDKILKRRK